MIPRKGNSPTSQSSLRIRHKKRAPLQDRSILSLDTTMASLFTRALLTLSFLISVILVCQADEASQRRSVYCDRRCLYFVNKMMRLKHRTTLPTFDQYDSSLRRFCRSANIESTKCTEFFGYALEHTGKSQSSWSICQNSKVCKADQQIEIKPVQKKAAQAAQPSSCKVCDALKKAFGSSFLRKQLSVLQKLISTVCKDSTSKEIKSSCGFVNKYLTAEKIQAMIPVKPELCENYLCNKAALRAFAFLPRSAGSCELCHKVLNMTLDGVIASMKIVDTVLQDVNNICDQLKTASEKTICRNAVKRTKEIFDYVMKQLKLTDLCEGLHICPGNKEDEPFFQVAKTFLSAKSESKACAPCESFERVAKGEKANFGSKISAIKRYMDEACANVKDENLRKKCAIAKPIVSMASSSAGGLLNADNCRNLMCGGAATFVKSIFPASEKSCSICKTTMKIVADGMKGAVSLVSGILKDVDTMCDSLSSAKSKKACHYAVSETGKIFKFVLSKLDVSKLCTDLGFCTKSINPNPGKMFSGLLVARNTSSASSEACPICDTLSDNAKTAGTIVSAQFAKLTANIKESCENANNNQALKCGRLQGFLSNFQGDLVSNVLLKNCRNIACSSFAKTLIGKIPKGPKACHYCKVALNITSTTMKQSGAVVHTILQSVAQICNNLKSEAAKKKCLSVVEETKVVFDYVLKRLDFSSVCKDLGMCPKEDSPVAKMYSSLSGKEKSAKCPLCDTVNKMGQDRFAKMQKAVFKLIKQVSGSCKEEQSPEINKMCALTLVNIKKMEDIKFPSNLCGQFLCSAAKAFPSFASKESCTICKNVAKIVSSSLGGAKQVVDVVLNDVEALCSKMRSESAKQQCNFAVKETRTGFQLLMKSLEPGTVCNDLHLCGSWQKSALSYVSKMTSFMKGSKNIDLCSSCKSFLDSLKTKNLKNSNILAICNSFGDSSTRDMCSTLSSRYYKVIAAQRSNIPSAEICAKLQICSKSNKGQQVLQMFGGFLGKLSSFFIE